MRRSAILLARVLAFVELYDLLPAAGIFFPDFVQKLVKQYSFQTFPKTAEDFDLKKGVQFLDGKIGDMVILKLGIWDSLLVIETRSNTTVSKKILEDMLSWGVTELGLSYKVGMIKRFAYISDVTFYSDAPLLVLASPALANLAAQTGKELSQIWNDPITYETTDLKVGHDTTSRKVGIAPFTISRRAETAFSENKYFSEAPLPTDVHWKLLETFEAELTK